MAAFDTTARKRPVNLTLNPLRGAGRLLRRRALHALDGAVRRPSEQWEARGRTSVVLTLGALDELLSRAWG
jgi:hypothetical protein